MANYTKNRKMPIKLPKVTKEKVIEALIETRGLQTLAADKLGVSRKTIWNYRQMWPEVDEAVQDWQERRLDRAESKLDDLVEAGELQAIVFILNCLGKRRGYGNQSKLEVTGADGQPIRIMTAQDLTDDELAKIATNQTE